MVEQEAAFEKIKGVAGLKPEGLLEIQLYWVEHAEIPERRIKERKMYRTLVSKIRGMKRAIEMEERKKASEQAP